MATLREQLEATRPNFREEGVWQRFLLDSYTGVGGYMGRVKQPPAGYWGSAAQAYSGFVAGSNANWFDTPTEADSYLDRFPREDIEKFQRRRHVAHFLNYCRPITNLLISYITRKPHVRTDVPKKLLKWIEDNDYDAGFGKRAMCTAVLGWCPVVVDCQPAPEGALTRATSGALEPYIVEMLPCHLADYETDEMGDFVWAKLAVQVTRKEAWNAEAQRFTRYTIWTRTDFEVYEISDGNADGVASPVRSGPHKLGRVPVVSWRAAVSVEDPVKAASTIADVALECRRLFNLTSEMDEHIRSQVFAVLLVPTKVGSDASAPQRDLGSENGLEVDADQKNLPQFIAPPADVAATLETRIIATIVEIYRLARVEYDKASGTQSSAQSKQQNFEQTNALLCDLAAALAASDLDTLRVVGKWLDCSDEELAKMRCVAYASYATEDLTVEIEMALQALSMTQLGRTAKARIMQRVVRQLVPNMSPADAKAIDSEIEEAVDQAERERADMQKAELDATKEPVVPDKPADDGDEEEVAA